MVGCGRGLGLVVAEVYGWLWQKSGVGCGRGLGLVVAEVLRFAAVYLHAVSLLYLGWK